MNDMTRFNKQYLKLLLRLQAEKVIKESLLWVQEHNKVSGIFCSSATKK